MLKVCKLFCRPVAPNSWATLIKNVFLLRPRKNIPDYDGCLRSDKKYLPFVVKKMYLNVKLMLMHMKTARAVNKTILFCYLILNMRQIHRTLNNFLP